MSDAIPRPDGSSLVRVEAPGQTPQSSAFDTFPNQGVPETTFVSDPEYGLDVIRPHRVDGPDHGTISLKGSASGKSIAEVLRSTRNAPEGAVAADPATGGATKLPGIAKAQLVHGRGYSTFHA